MKSHPLDIQPELRNCAYDGKTTLKPAGIEIKYTEEQVFEIARCAADCQYFIDNYVQIVNVDRGLIPFEMYPFQKKMVDLIVNSRFSIMKLSRQCGKTQSVTAILLWYLLFNQNYTIAILANKEDTAKEIMYRLQLCYENLPKFLQQGIVEFNKKNVEVENGSRIFASSTGGSAIRGKSVNFVYLDEFAFVPFNIQEEFFASVFPTISSGTTTKLCITSTPNGMNKFHEIWTKAEKHRNSFKSLTVHWSEVPGRDAKWAKEQIGNTSQRQFDVEYGCEFLGSTATLIDPRKLTIMEADDPIHQDTHFTIYEWPEEKHVYAITVDTAEGIGLDSTVFIVFDVTTPPYKMVALYHNNEIAPQLSPHIILDVATKYNNAAVLFETQGHGLTSATILHSDLEYENVLSTVSRGAGGQAITTTSFAGSNSLATVRLGVHTSKRTKSVGCSTLKNLIENDQLMINDARAINELSTFIQSKTTFQAEEGKHDDVVMALVIFAWMTTQNFFIELTDVNIRERVFATNASAIEQMLTPFGFINNGVYESGSDQTNPFTGDGFDDLFIQFLQDNYT